VTFCPLQVPPAPPRRYCDSRGWWRRGPDHRRGPGWLATGGDRGARGAGLRAPPPQHARADRRVGRVPGQLRGSRRDDGPVRRLLLGPGRNERDADEFGPRQWHDGKIALCIHTCINQSIHLYSTSTYASDEMYLKCNVVLLQEPVTSLGVRPLVPMNSRMIKSISRGLGIFLQEPVLSLVANRWYLFTVVT
jgi:hypothetical protein